MRRDSHRRRCPDRRPRWPKALATPIWRAAAVAAGLLGASTAEAADPRDFTCDAGPFAKTATNQSLTQAFSAANIKRANGKDSEGFRYSYTKVFPRDPEKSADVNWFDNSDRKGPHTVTTEAKAYWRGPHGVHPGMSLAELENANGRPFSFMNVNTDVGAGEVMNWNGGALQGVMRDCGLTVTLSPADPDAFTARVSSDMLKSDDPTVRDGKFEIIVMGLKFEPK
jgi:hypothetical protein